MDASAAGTYSSPACYPHEFEPAPSTTLRQLFHRDPARWLEFVRRYRAELRAQAAALQSLRQRAAQQRVTLLYGARDPLRNHALVLRDVLRKS